jgi:hypothetical protein
VFSVCVASKTRNLWSSVIVESRSWIFNFIKIRKMTERVQIKFYSVFFFYFYIVIHCFQTNWANIFHVNFPNRAMRDMVTHSSTSRTFSLCTICNETTHANRNFLFANAILHLMSSPFLCQSGFSVCCVQFSELAENMQRKQEKTRIIELNALYLSVW